MQYFVENTVNEMNVKLNKWVGLPYFWLQRLNAVKMSTFQNGSAINTAPIKTQQLCVFNLTSWFWSLYRNTISRHLQKTGRWCEHFSCWVTNLAQAMRVLSCCQSLGPNVLYWCLKCDVLLSCEFCFVYSLFCVKYNVKMIFKNNNIKYQGWHVSPWNP
jgi:hypothetical protein